MQQNNSENRIKYLTNSQVKSLLYQAKKTSIRDYVLLFMAYRYGMRREEIRILNWGDINLKEKMIWVKAVKNGNSRGYQLRDDEVKLLSHYRKSLETSPQLDTPLIISAFGRRISRAQIHNIFVHYRKMARIPKGFSFHSLRHSIAMGFMNSGVSSVTLEFVQKHLRHKDIRSTQIYAHMLDTRAETIKNEVMDTTGAIV